MRMNFLILIAITGLIGCASTMPKEIDVPVMVQAKCPTIPPKPILPIANLTKNSKPNEVIKAYVLSVNKLQEDDDVLRTILKGYPCKDTY